MSLLLFNSFNITFRCVPYVVHFFWVSANITPKSPAETASDFTETRTKLNTPPKTAEKIGGFSPVDFCVRHFPQILRYLIIGF